MVPTVIIAFAACVKKAMSDVCRSFTKSRPNTGHESLIMTILKFAKSYLETYLNLWTEQYVNLFLDDNLQKTRVGLELLESLQNSGRNDRKKSLTNHEEHSFHKYL